jgi:hypothetical protein
MTAEWRKVETQYSEEGHDDRVDVTYEFGAEIDGVWVAAVTKNGGYIDHRLSVAKAEQEQAAKDSQPATTTDTAAEPSA